VEDSVKLAGFRGPGGREWEDLADLQAFVKEEAGSFNRVTQEPTEQPILRFRFCILVLELCSVGGNKAAEPRLLRYLLRGDKFAADLKNLDHVQLMLKAAEERGLQGGQVDVYVERLRRHLRGQTPSISGGAQRRPLHAVVGQHRITLAAHCRNLR
jgi:hypothetical protein